MEIRISNEYNDNDDAIESVLEEAVEKSKVLTGRVKFIALLSDISTDDFTKEFMVNYGTDADIAKINLSILRINQCTSMNTIVQKICAILVSEEYDNLVLIFDTMPERRWISLTHLIRLSKSLNAHIFISQFGKIDDEPMIPYFKYHMTKDMFKFDSNDMNEYTNIKNSEGD